MNGIFFFASNAFKSAIKNVKNPKSTPCPQWNSKGSCPLIILAAPTCKTLSLSCRRDALFKRAAGDTQDVCGPQSPHSGRGGEAGLRWREMRGGNESDGGRWWRREEEKERRWAGGWIGWRLLMGNEGETR